MNNDPKMELQEKILKLKQIICGMDGQTGSPLFDLEKFKNDPDFRRNLMITVRKFWGLTQTEWADLFETRQDVLSRWETGSRETRPTTEDFKKYIKIINHYYINKSF